MDSDGTRFAEISETTSFLHYFSGLPDHRQPGKVDYPLPEVLLLILLAVLAGAERSPNIAPTRAVALSTERSCAPSSPSPRSRGRSGSAGQSGEDIRDKKLKC